jgi:arylsulfatase A-like enzyme
MGVRGNNPSTGARDAWTLKAAYYAMLKLVDDQLGRLLQAIDDGGDFNNTLVIFSTDHGESLGDHGLIEKGCRFYEGLVRVPLIFSWPGQIKTNLQSDALVELMDIAPTLLDAATIAKPSHMQGQSLWPLLTGKTDPRFHKPFVRSEYFDALKENDGTRATMYRDDRYKLVVYHGHDLGELYDLNVDPGEFNDLWDDPNASDIKNRLIHQSFDATMLVQDLGPPRIGPM